MGRLEHDWRVVAVAAAVSAVVTTVVMQVSTVTLAFASGNVVAGAVAGVLVSVEDYAGSEGAGGAVLGTLVGVVLGHPALAGTVKKLLWGSQAAVTPEVIGTSRVLVAPLWIPVAMGTGFVVARTVTAVRRRSDSAASEESFELDDPAEW
jgi:hypothetical protein